MKTTQGESLMYHGSVEVKHLRGRTYDCFWDQGWDNWSRVVVKKQEVILIKGQEIDGKDKKMVLDATTSLGA